MKEVKEAVAIMLFDWLIKDFGLLIDEPTEEQIIEGLEEHDVE